MIKKGTRLDGIVSIADIKLRCVVDDLTGCWHLRDMNGMPIPRGTTYRLHIHGRGVIGAKKAAWLLKHGLDDLPEGQRVFGVCESYDCVNTAHLRCGTPAEHGAAIAASGRFRGVPKRIAANTRTSRLHRAVITPEQRKWAVESPLSAAKAAQVLGCAASTVHSARQDAKRRLRAQLGIKTDAPSRKTTNVPCGQKAVPNGDANSGRARYLGWVAPARCECEEAA